MKLETQNENIETALDSNDIDELNGDIIEPEEVVEILDKSDIADDDKLKIMKCVTSVEHFSGPIPHPSIIAGYEQILPGSADRILKMAETQIQHRHSIEDKMSSADSRDSLLGIIAAWTICIACLIGGGFLACKAPNVVGNVCGVLMASGGIAGVISAFLKGTKAAWKDKDD